MRVYARTLYTVKRHASFCVLYAFFFYNRTCIGVDGFVTAYAIIPARGAGGPTRGPPPNVVLGALPSVPRPPGRTTGARRCRASPSVGARRVRMFASRSALARLPARGSRAAAGQCGADVAGSTGRRDPTGGAPRAVLVVVKIRFQIQIQSIGMWPRHRCCTSRQDCARNANNCCRNTTVKWAAHKQLQRERSWPARVFIVKAGRRDAHQAERADNEAGEQRTAKDKIRHVRACALPSPLQSNREACASCGRRDDYRRPQKVSLVVHLGRAHVSHCKGTEQRSC